MDSNTTRPYVNLWDEILKSIVEEMPHQLLPLIKDVFKIEYSDNIPITLLQTEHVVPKDSDNKQN
ncbi:MAG: hypothetical protein IKP29_01135 [Pseudobutyrivibrio sp.]|nr:hypothetical protein [Pseudobutyrivibrio sp.]